MLAYQCRVAMLTLEPDRDSNADLPMPFGMLTLEPDRIW